METVRTRASESIVFGLKSTKKSTKVVKKRWCICSGTGGREFESRHFDQKYGESIALPIFLFVVPRLDKFRVAECECANFAGECVKLACKPSAKLFCRRQSPRHILFLARIDSNSYCEQSEAGSSALILRRAHDARISAASRIILPLGKAPATSKINPQVRNHHRFSLFSSILQYNFEILQLQVAFFVIILFKSIDFYHII